MSNTLIYDYASRTTHKGIPMITARHWRSGQTKYDPLHQGAKEKAKRVRRMSQDTV